MCTVSYIPTEKGCILTSNRDEDPDRKTLPPSVWALGEGMEIKAPLDEEKQGTWIATDQKGRVGCLLNGAFRKHKRKLPYRLSRGALIPMAFKADSFFAFYKTIDLNGIEPFTLILVDNFLQVIIWDGKKKQIQFLSRNKPHLWSSATLYTPEAHRLKQVYFSEFLHKMPHPEGEDLLELHGAAGNKAFILMRPGVQTVSITQIETRHDRSFMTYLQPVGVAVKEIRAK